MLKNMEKCGVLRFFKKEKYRNPYADLPAAPKAAEIELSAEQTKAYNTLSAMLDGGRRAARCCTALLAAARPRYICA